MLFQYIRWDSDFFKIKIGKCTSSNNDTLEEIQNYLNSLNLDNYNLIYIFCKKRIAFPLNTIKLVDKKVIYHRNLTKQKYKVDNNIFTYNEQVISDDLLKLTLESGKYSRFKTDISFPHNSFNNLYTRWIERSVNGEIADKVYIYTAGLKIVGFITIKISGKIGTIGLIAVSNEIKGKGIGTKLMEAAFAFLQSKNIYRIEVVTQLDNEIACKFYEKNKLKVKEVNYIYHYWISNIEKNDSIQ